MLMVINGNNLGNLLADRILTVFSRVSFSENFSGDPRPSKTDQVTLDIMGLLRHSYPRSPQHHEWDYLIIDHHIQPDPWTCRYDKSENHPPTPPTHGKVEHVTYLDLLPGANCQPISSSFCSKSTQRTAFGLWMPLAGGSSVEVFVGQKPTHTAGRLPSPTLKSWPTCWRFPNHIYIYILYKEINENAYFSPSICFFHLPSGNLT